MKHTFFLIITIFCITNGIAQDITNDSEKIYYAVETKPDFKGGIKEFYNYIGKNFRVPNVNKLSGKVIVSFVVEKDGSLTDIKVIRDIGYGTGEEAIRVLKNSPTWIPGYQSGKPVRVMYTLPIVISTN